MSDIAAVASRGLDIEVFGGDVVPPLCCPSPSHGSADVQRVSHARVAGAAAECRRLSHIFIVLYLLVINKTPQMKISYEKLLVAVVHSNIPYGIACRMVVLSSQDGMCGIFTWGPMLSMPFMFSLVVAMLATAFGMLGSRCLTLIAVSWIVLGASFQVPIGSCLAVAVFQGLFSEPPEASPRI